MESIVIVALPEVDDKVHRISSEKVPHLTMLYLGESVNNLDIPDIVTFVQHAAKHVDPFYLTVDYRDVLGDSQADVLFFEDNLWQMPNLKQFRHNLLQNDSIRRAYDTTEQFSEWKPHLTLGYPETPANEDVSDYPGIHGVHFDRLAVWFGDYNGPEIRLKRDDTMEVRMSDMTTTERGEQAVSEMFHYGVRGMRWGITTKDRATSIQSKAARKQASATAMKDRAERRSSKLGSAAEARKGAKLQKEADRLTRRGATLQKKADKKVAPTEVSVSQKKPGAFAKTQGGANQPLHEDAVKALVARQKAKSSTTDSLSNAELRSAVDRMQLEQKYTQLSFASDRRSRGARFAAGLFGQRKSLKFKDMDEEAGEETRKAIKVALATKVAAKA